MRDNLNLHTQLAGGLPRRIATALLGLCVMAVCWVYVSGAQTAHADQPAEPPDLVPANEDPAPAPEPPPRRRRRAGMKGPPPDNDRALWQLLGDSYPEYARKLRRRGPRESQKALRQMRPWLHRLRQVRARNPELGQLIIQQHRTEMALDDCRKQWASSISSEQRKNLSARIERLIEQRVDVRLQRRQMEIKILEQRLRDLKARLAKQLSDRDDLVEQEFQAILRARPHSPRRRPGPPRPHQSR